MICHPTRAVEQSVENPVEEQLKDPNAGEITLEGVLRVRESAPDG